jgi:hypothetical protein
LPIGKVIFCREFAICFTPKDKLFDIVGEIVSYSDIDLNKSSEIVYIKWIFQLSYCDTGVKVFKGENLLLLTVGEACLWYIKSGILDLEG